MKTAILLLIAFLGSYTAALYFVDFSRSGDGIDLIAAVVCLAAGSYILWRILVGARAKIYELKRRR